MGMPLPSALATVTMSGRMPACWKPNHSPVRPRPVCTSSTISSTPRSSHRVAQVLHVTLGRRVDAALALHDFDQHRGGRRVDAALEIDEIEGGDVVEAFRQRLELLVLGRLPGGVQRGQRAAVK